MATSSYFNTNTFFSGHWNSIWSVLDPLHSPYTPWKPEMTFQAYRTQDLVESLCMMLFIVGLPECHRIVLNADLSGRAQNMEK